jgi:Mn2+/Fe2+ NRAMP family transporter
VTGEPSTRPRRYPLGAKTPPAVLDAEAEQLEAARSRPVWSRVGTYVRLGGPGFLGAALTLGAGSMTAAMLAGATFGYRTLWIFLVAIGSGAFMMAAMARFTCRGGFSVIEVQKRRHGRFLAVVLTALIGVVSVAVVFNFGQYALGTHLIESLAELAGLSFPRRYNWVAYLALSSWIALSYGRSRSGTLLVERFMKWSLLVMLVCFGLTLAIVGVDWAGLVRGLFIPWLPSGIGGIDLFIASSAAAIGVMDWLMFHYAGLAKGWGPRHEHLARVDIVIGFVLPFLAVNVLVVSVFAGTLYGAPSPPQTAAELARALAPLLGERAARAVFYLGFLAVPITTTVGMSLAGTIALHEAFGWQPDPRSWRWRAAILLPQVGFLAAWFPSPLLLVIIIAGLLSVTNNVVGWSLYLLFNDREVLGEHRSRSYLWNLGILAQVTLLNLVAIAYVFNRLGWWG